jgi:hypothetical protein
MRRTLGSLFKGVVFYHKRKKEEHNEKLTQYKTKEQFIFLSQHYILESFIFIYESFKNGFTFVKKRINEIKLASKDILHSNLRCAKGQLENGNFLDAELRLKTILIFSKNNFDALLMLAYHYYNILKYDKSLKYLNAIKASKQQNTPIEVDYMINDIKEKQSVKSEA